MKVTAALLHTEKIESQLAITATIAEWRDIEKKLSAEGTHGWHAAPAEFAGLLRTMIARVEQQLTETRDRD